MFFTRDDYKKIENWLKERSVKDSQFEEVIDTYPNDDIMILQNGENKRVKIGTFIADNADFINVTKTFGLRNCTIEEAAQTISEQFRKPGLEITFIAPTGVWMSYQYINDDTINDAWSNKDNWRNTLVDASGLNLDNDTLVLRAGVAEVRNGSLVRDKLASDVINELDRLQIQINAINSREITMTTTLSHNYYYIGYPLNVTITGNLNLPNTMSNDTIETISIYENDVVVNTDTKKSFVSYSTIIDSNLSYYTKAHLSAPYDLDKISSITSFIGVKPIYIGVDSAELSNEQYMANVAIESKLYNKNSPVPTLIGKTITFQLEDSQRVVIVSENPNLGAKSGGFDFPFNRTYMENGMYLYTSINTYSNQSQELVFESKHY